MQYFDTVTRDLKCQVITFGEDPKNHYSAANIRFDEFGRPTYTLVIDGKEITDITLHVFGKHNVYNSLSAIAAATELDIEIDAIKAGLLHCKGAERRFEYKGTILDNVKVMDDYAHHPTEITATLKAAANYPHKTLWCVFQPHTYSRTNAFLKDFAKALTLADKVILADIYAAREKNTIGITSKDLQTEIEKLGKECYYFHSFDEIENFLLENCINGDLLITMGAGDVVKIGENLLGI